MIKYIVLERLCNFPLRQTALCILKSVAAKAQKMPIEPAHTIIDRLIALLTDEPLVSRPEKRTDLFLKVSALLAEALDEGADEQTRRAIRVALALTEPSNLTFTAAAVKVHVKSVLRKLKAQNRKQAEIVAHQHGVHSAASVA